MTISIRTLARREPRYRVQGDSELAVTLEQRGESSRILSAELVDISARGAKFKVGAALAVKEAATVRIETKQPKRTLVALGEVRWASLAAGGVWRIGCSLDPPIPAEVLQAFAEAGILERREHRRESVLIPATGKWELAGCSIDVSILDLSQGGFCLLSQAECRPGERVLLQLREDDDREVLVLGRARWQVESERGFVIGCEFIIPRHYAVLKKARGTQPFGDGKQQSVWARIRRRVPPRKGDTHREQDERRGAHGRSTLVCAASALVLLGMTICRSAIQQPLGPPNSGSRVVNSASVLGPAGARRPPQPGPDVYREPGAEANATATIPAPILGNETGQAHFSLADETRQNLSRLPLVDLPSSDAGSTPLHTSVPLRPRPIEPSRRGAGIEPPSPAHLFNLISLTVSAQSLQQGVGSAATVRGLLRTRSDERGRAFADQATFAHLARTPVSSHLLFNDSATVPLPSFRPSLERAVESFHHGRDSYSARRYEESAVAWQTAVRHDPANALYLYVLAMAQYQLELYDQAERSVQQAMELEREQPIEHWGTTMERYQGRARVWLEEARRKLGAANHPAALAN